MLNPAWIIQRKRDGYELSAEEIGFFIRGIVNGDVADYQATAFLMATYFRGMTLDETVTLTRAMLDSGERYRLESVKRPKVDKHSTGGVGDKVSLILAPLAAACGLAVPMMAGRGLGHSGGTLDKLESIPGYDVKLGRERFEEAVNKVGCAIIGQSERIAPADKKLYALRDVTATIECTPLIVASILSKKLAEGAQALVLDVKVGSGAFMKSAAEARKLARTLIQVAKKMGLPCRAVLSNMNEPLGYSAGNAIEVAESIEVLRDRKRRAESSCDLRELTIHLCAHMLDLGGAVKNLAEGRKLATARLADGSAWKKFRELVDAQGGKLESFADPRDRDGELKVTTWSARRRGYISAMDTEELGKILVDLGGGRRKVTDAIHPRVGIVFHRKLGARVQAGEPLATVYAPKNFGDPEFEGLENRFHQSISLSGARKAVPKLVFEELK